MTEDHEGLVTEDLRYSCGCRSAREEFHATCHADLLAGKPAPLRVPGCLAAMGILLVIGEIAFTGAGLLDRLPRGPVQWAAAAVTGLALVAQFNWLNHYFPEREAASRRDPLAERLAEEGPHPALTELAARNPEDVALLRVSRSRTRRRRNRGRRRRGSTPAVAGH